MVIIKELGIGESSMKLGVNEKLYLFLSILDLWEIGLNGSQGGPIFLTPPTISMPLDPPTMGHFHIVSKPRAYPYWEQAAEFFPLWHNPAGGKPSDILVTSLLTPMCCLAYLLIHTGSLAFRNSAIFLHFGNIVF